MSSVNDVGGGLILLAVSGLLAKTFGTGGGGTGRIEEGCTAFATEEVQFVVEPLAEGRVVDGNVPLVHDGCRTMITFTPELLQPIVRSMQRGAGRGTHLEVIHMAVRLSLVFVSTDVLQSDLTRRTA